MIAGSAVRTTRTNGDGERVCGDTARSQSDSCRYDTVRRRRSFNSV